MRKELFETGKSVDTAIDSACEKLGCLREDCEWEIIDLPKKGFFGLKNTPAKVRVSVEVPDEKPEKIERQEKIEKPVIEQKLRQENRQKEQKPERTEKPRQDKKPQEKRNRESKPEPIKLENISEKERLAKEYLAEILESAGLKAEYSVTHEHGGSCINIIGEGLGMIIGRRGETLDAIQYLTGLVANRGEGDYMRLTVDCGDYRVKRKDTLEALAKKLASQVVKTNISKTLEPMNPFERRIIHATVSEIEGVSSSSVGEEPNRRVVITSPTARPASRGGYRGNRDSEHGGYRENRGRFQKRNFHTSGENAESAGEKTNNIENRERPARPPRDGNHDRRGDRGRGAPRQIVQAPQGPPKKTPETEATMGVSFGKIDLD